MAIAQNGTGATAAIQGGTSGATSSAPTTLSTASVAASTSAANSGMTAGAGTISDNGACSCSCLCGTAAFPNAAIQGVAAFGGMAGEFYPSSQSVTKVKLTAKP